MRLGADLGLDVVAGDVETVAHLEALRAMGCPSVQRTTGRPGRR